MFRSSSPAARAARFGVIGATAALALVLTACSSGTSDPGSSPAASGSSTNAAVAAKVAKLEKLPASYPIPSGQVSGISKLKGKTVYYIPLTQQSPQFGVTQVALQAALGKVGISLQVCNGNATPTNVAACFSQATKADAAAIITDAVPYVLAANSFSAAVSAGIPVLYTDQTAGSGAPAASSKFGYVYAPGGAQMAAVADWIINDSGGKGNVLINESTDGPSPVSFVESAQTEFKKECPGCTVTTNKISSANFSLIAPSTSSALLKDPGVQYVISEFDQYLQPTQGGVQQAGKTATVKGVSGAAQLSGLQQLANKNFLYADVGQASAYQGWVDADAVLRMLTGTSGASLPAYTIPIRLFTRDNIGSVKLTDAAQASGAWFGPSDYTKSFLKLWGVN